ncbi:MAG: PEP-utilizing enzyme [Candidatus Helarchaeota archaeon]
MAPQKIGKGRSVSSKEDIEGEFRVVMSVEDVLKLLEDGAENKIVIVEDCGTTTLGPILSQIKGVICTSGSEGSHLAIVSREFEIPALMGARFNITNYHELNGKSGKIINVDEDYGEIYLND